MADDYEQLRKQMNGVLLAWNNIMEILQPAYQAMLDSITYLYDVMYDQYKLAGLPHGDSHDGFILWINEMKKETEHAKSI